MSRAPRGKFNKAANPKLLSKKQLASELIKRTLFSYDEMEQVIDHMFDIMAEELYKMKEINIVNFGRFILYKHKVRPVRNPKTMEEFMLTEHYSVRFKPSSYIKKRIKNKTEVTSD